MSEARPSIVPTTPTDLELSFRFFNSAIAYQRSKGYELWPQFESSLIEREMAEGRHWKVTDGRQVLGIFSVQYQDPVIWGEKDKDPAVYLHRIAVNPELKGKGLMRVIKEWALNHAKEKNKLFLRMDTWGNNEQLRNYYIACGFTYIGQKELRPQGNEPGHYGGNLLSLFEEKV